MSVQIIKILNAFLSKNNRMKKAYEKVVSEYKETNAELRNGLGLKPEAIPIVVKTEATEEEEDEDVFESSFVGEARKQAKSRSSTAVKRKTKTNTQTQVSRLSENDVTVLRRKRLMIKS